MQESFITLNLQTNGEPQCAKILSIIFFEVQMVLNYKMSGFEQPFAEKPKNAFFVVVEPLIIMPKNFKILNGL